MSEKPGTELEKILSSWPFRITASKSCGCRITARRMDILGSDWCESEDGMTQIIADMRENAARLGIPFVEPLARALVRRAARIARKKAHK